MDRLTVVNSVGMPVLKSPVICQRCQGADWDPITESGESVASHLAFCEDFMERCLNQNQPPPFEVGDTLYYVSRYPEPEVIEGVVYNIIRHEKGWCAWTKNFLVTPESLCWVFTDQKEAQDAADQLWNY